jgi:hypothetical protein
MKTILLAAAAALSLGIGSAYAGDGEGPAGGYVYPGYIVPGSIYGGAKLRCRIPRGWRRRRTARLPTSLPPIRRARAYGCSRRTR